MVGWFLRTWWVYVLLACILSITGFILPAAHVASATTSIFTTLPGQPLPMPTLVIPVQPITDQFAAGQSMPGQLYAAELAPSISSTSGAFHLLRPDVRDFPSYPSMPVEVPETPPVSSSPPPASTEKRACAPRGLQFRRPGS